MGRFFTLTWAAFNTLFVHRIVFIGFVLFFNFRFFTTCFTRTRRTAIVGIQINVIKVDLRLIIAF
ncbi:hypothetical protein NGUA15_02983 [Salmonella enterica]|nr:hypothetical protein NGUA15_02983 [Salmonella enterica]